MDTSNAKVLLMRMLQDVCSVTSKLPSVYQMQFPVHEEKRIASGGESSIYRGIAQSKLVAIRRPHSPNDGWDSEAGQEALKVSNLIKKISSR